MGGHGGLNILPQKKWNVYRKDVQFKVHFDENKIIKEKGEKARNKNEAEFEKNISELKRNIENEEERHSENNNEHINLFLNEEKELNKRKKQHEEFLIKSGHYIYNSNQFDGTQCIYDANSKVKIISDFDKIKNIQDQWYLNRYNGGICGNNNVDNDNKREEHNKRNELEKREMRTMMKASNSEQSTEVPSFIFGSNEKLKHEKKIHNAHIEKLIKHRKEKKKLKENEKKHKHKHKHKHKSKHKEKKRKWKHKDLYE